jgi:uncharacterized protein (TIRG00374 family)
MNRPYRRGYAWLLTVLRYGLCAAAIVYLYYNVNWHDRVQLADGQWVRLVRETPDGQYEVLRDGRREIVAATDVRAVPSPSGDTPNIEYGIVSVAQRIDWRLALISLVVFAPVPFMSAQRLMWMLAIQDVRLTLWQSIQLCFAGNFFNFVLPGTVGGDVVKAYYISLRTHRKTEAITTVFLDRVVGLLGLMLLATLMFVLSRAAVAWEARLYATMALGLTLIWSALLVGCIVLFSSRLRSWTGLSSLAARLPAGAQLLRVGRAIVAMRHHPNLVLLSLFITVLLQLLVVFSAWIMSLALDLRGSFVLYFICVPIGFLIGSIPISPPQALGVMEAAYLQFFAQGGLNSKAQALAFALAVRFIQLVWSLPGVLVPLLGAHLPKRTELEALAREEPEPAMSQS